MTVHLVNPSHLSFGVGVITPRWLFVLGAATPPEYGRPRIVDETLEPLALDTVQAGDIVVEITPTEHMGFLRYDDRPGVVASVGRVLGEAGINIASMQVGRSEKGGAALMVMAVDSAIASDDIERMVAEIGGSTGRVVHLPV